MSSLTWIFSLLTISLYFSGCHGDTAQKSVKVSAVGVFRTKMYTYHHEEVSFFEAFRQCALNDGALLTSVNDADELAALSTLMRNWNTAYHYVWVGGYKVHPHYEWLNSGAKIDDSLFTTQTPDLNRKCAILKRENTCSSWKLYEGYCNAKAPFICAK